MATDLDNMRAIFQLSNVTCREYTTNSRVFGENITVLETRVQKFDPELERELHAAGQVKVLNIFDKGGKLLRVMVKQNARKAYNPQLRELEDQS